MEYRDGQIVAVNMKYGDGTTVTIQGRIEKVSKHGVFIENQLIAYSWLTPATPEQIQIVIDEENRTLAMLRRGDHLMNVLSECEAMAEQEDAE